MTAVRLHIGIGSTKFELSYFASDNRDGQQPNAVVRILDIVRYFVGILDVYEEDIFDQERHVRCLW